MKEIKIQIDNPVFGKLKDPKDRKFILKDIVFTEEKMTGPSPFSHMNSNIEKKEIIDKAGEFDLGHLQYIRQCFKSQNISVVEENTLPEVELQIPTVEGISFRDYQLFAFKKIKIFKRGLITYPTGSGKGVIILGLLKMIPDGKVLILCRRADIISQLYENVKSKNIGDCVFATTKWNRTGQFVFATEQAFCKIPSERHIDYFDMIIEDEVHNFSNQGKSILDNSLAQIRVGLTAKLPEKKLFKMLLIKGCFGEVLTKMSYEEAQERNFVSKVKMFIVDVEPIMSLKGKYIDNVSDGIVRNKRRNRVIAEFAKSFIKQGKSILLMVVSVEHGKILERLTGFEFLHGGTAKHQRDLAKKKIESKKIKGLITTIIWQEGVDIPSLDGVGLCFGGKSDIRTIQTVGRIVRTHSEKERGYVFDFLDHGKYLSEHFAQRLSLYIEQGWDINFFKDPFFDKNTTFPEL